jgi:hypothetical protein
LAGLLGVGAGASPAAARDENLFIRPEDQRTVLFGSLDAGRSVFMSGGAKQSLVGSLDRSGFMALEVTGFGLTQERLRTDGGDLPVLRFTHQTAVTPGYQWNLGALHLGAYAGPELHQEQVTYGGRALRFSKPRLGIRGQVDLWAHPSADTLVTGTLISGSTRASLWGRASAGLRVTDGLFAGPEVTFYVTPTYSEVRWGAHVTGLRLWILTFRASAGWMQDDAHRRGSPYLGLSVWMRL